MNMEMILGLVRHVLTFAGGYLTTQGLATTDEVQGGIGAIVTLAGIVWSVIAKKNAKPA